VGETASTGVHGANRLASNSLLECVVFGAQFADLEIDRDWANSDAGVLPLQEFNADLGDDKTQLEELRQKIPRLVWQNAGICRVEEGLQAAIAQLESWQQEFADLPLSQFLGCLRPTQPANFDLPESSRLLRLWAETRNLLDVAYLILKSAAFRTESRGGHYRLDYPQPDPAWQVHTLVQDHKWWKSAD
jgi:L-aspartate oxidase